MTRDDPGTGPRGDRGQDQAVADVRKRLGRALRERYTVGRTLAAGGASLVFLAKDLKHGRSVAIKVLRPGLAEGLGVQRFLEEIRIEASLEHANVVPIYDSGEAGGLPYYVMPFFEGESLRDRLAREGPLPLDEALAITRDVARALRAAHARGILHRDIKPANILLQEGRAVVTDFGIARALRKAGARRTATGLSLGTPGYMSPEQASGERELDARSDQYSLACVVHEMLTGEPLFSGPSGRSIIAKHISLPPPPVRTLRPGVPEGVERALLRALEKPTVDRFESIDEFVAALTAPAPSSPGPWTRAVAHARARPAATAVALLAVAALTWLVMESTGVEEPAWIGGAPESVVVLPFHTPASSEQERAYAVQIADRVARELNRWEPVRAVGHASLSGIIHDVGVSGPTFESADAAVRVAREAETQALVGITVELAGDSALVDASLYDVRTGRPVDRPLAARALRAGTDDLVASLVYRLLRVDGEVAAVRRGLRPGTSVPEALIANVEGLDALARARLGEAERGFRRAVDLDSTYSVALTNLALTIYWQAVDGERGWHEASSEITRWSTRAMSYLGGLKERDRLHVQAFYDFQLGDYEEARRKYEAILRADPTDLHAWLMLGTVETNDPWLVLEPDGALTPRADLSRALTAFARTIRLQPDFELGYLRFSEVYHTVEGAIDLRACPTFEVLREQLVPPWQTPSLERGLAFCPVAGDSVVWVAKALFDALPSDELEAGADRLYARSVGMLERWAAFAPSAPKPRQALADLVLARRARQRIAAPERLRRLVLQGLEHARAALALQSDTVPADLVRIANLHLGAGQREAAYEAVAAGLASMRREDGSWSVEPPRAAANVFLALGQLETALSIVTATFQDQRRGIEDPATGELLWYEGAEPTVMRIKVLGVAAVRGPRLRDELGAMVEAWRTAGYGERERRLLRDHATMRIASALALDPVNLANWADDIEVEHPLWLALELADTHPVDARRRFMEAEVAEALSMTSAERAFALGVAAGRVGEAERAVQWFSRLDSLPHRLGGFDVGWGLQSLSRLLRAEALEARDRVEPALDELRAFLADWDRADSLAIPQVERAQALLARLEGR